MYFAKQGDVMTDVLTENVDVIRGMIAEHKLSSGAPTSSPVDINLERLVGERVRSQPVTASARGGS